MSSISFQEIISSKLIKFNVGSEADGHSSEFFVHEKAVSQLSKPWATSVRETSGDARHGLIWKDVRRDTFQNFAQYAYTGDYSIPDAVKRDTATKKPYSNGVTHSHVPGSANGTPAPSSTNGIDPTMNGAHDRSTSETSNEALRRSGQHGPSTVEKPEEDTESPATNAIPSSPSTKRTKKKKSKAATKALSQDAEVEINPDFAKEPAVDLNLAVPEPTESGDSDAENGYVKKREVFHEEAEAMPSGDFTSLSYPLLAPRDHYTGTCEPASEFENDKSYSNVFLCHASLYDLGNTHVIAPLKALSLYKLHKTLLVFQLNRSNIADITDLAKYVYSKGVTEMDTDIGGLRYLVCQYMAIHAVELSRDAHFMNLLAGGGQIVKDFFKFQLQMKDI